MPTRPEGQGLEAALTQEQRRCPPNTHDSHGAPEALPAQSPRCHTCWSERAEPGFEPKQSGAGAQQLLSEAVWALAGVAQWIEHQPSNQSVASSIPSQGTCLGFGPGPQQGAHERQPHIDVSLPLFLPPFPSL